MSYSHAPARRRHDSRESVTPTASFNEQDTTTSEVDTPEEKRKPELPSRRLNFEKFLHRQVQTWQLRVPLLRKLVETFHRIPPRLRVFFLVGWILWKVVLLLVFLRIFLLRYQPLWSNLHSIPQNDDVQSYRNRQSPSLTSAHDWKHATLQETTPVKLLYVVTALAEYNTGLRKTKRGQDRYAEVLMPVLIDGVESLVSPPYSYQVDVYLILGYTLPDERQQLLRDRLPEGVGLQVWSDAIPLGYDGKKSKDSIVPNTRALARQHRYVIKDKLSYYDIFLAFEDDMRLTGPQVQHFIQMSTDLEALRKQAPLKVPGVPELMDPPSRMKFFGNMTQHQMNRLLPGFVRVEVLLNETLYGAQTTLDNIPLDYEATMENGGGSSKTTHIDPSICCHVPNMRPNVDNAPRRPSYADVIIWETNIKGLMLRQLPPGSQMLDWVVLLMGPGKRLKPEEMIGGYWSGRDGAFGKDYKRPSGGVPDLIAQQGGWMATHEQIVRLHNDLCQDNFLPPFNAPSYHDDGQASMNVEFWSGSYQLFTGIKGGCNMQRLVSFHPDHFSKHLIYHVANNKQRQLPQRRMLRADHLYAQLNTVKKTAEQAKANVWVQKRHSIDSNT